MGSHGDASKAPGIRFLERASGSVLSFRTQQAIVLFLTFLSYACYHAARKTTSIVKTVLLPDSPEPCSAGGGGCGWAPFDLPEGTAMLGEIDVAFLSVYSLGIFLAGHLGDRLDLRKFLAVGMAGTGLFTFFSGAGYWLNIHSFSYYLVVQMLAGVFQSTGWPTVVAVVGRWCGKSKRGLIMGIWNAHTSVGNIMGSLIAAALLKYGWGAVVFLFLPVSPEAARTSREGEDEGMKSPGKEALLGEREEEKEEERAVGFMEALKIPGVAQFALCLFFSKLVAYTFLYWLPSTSTRLIDGEYLSDSVAANLSTLFDVGGVAGGILAGHISDRLEARAITAAGFTYCAIPALFLYRIYGGVSLLCNAALMLAAGVFVIGPYALITTAVSADLGTGGGAATLKGNSRALATVTAIIDGTGSVGAASWSDVFEMLMAAAFVAGLLLTRLVVAEVNAKIDASRSRAARDWPAPPEV
ncbi:unnamed protein product [Spirodela intermedia]|uniref:Major facilitator superfamily (MFS) profile domain-containing protein n=1 Tax=Spirodela intermedia TaxID=51605 RepID=A0A7I8IZ81_SPIIN|nr:unnamed protein product [Spirodela intermedia]CAA6663295.1 unnamed protein product [Spirodela intermedia]